MTILRIFCDRLQISTYTLGVTEVVEVGVETVIVADGAIDRIKQLSKARFARFLKKRTNTTLSNVMY
jgi:hypothetical protein